MENSQKACDIREGGQNQVLHCSSTCDNKMAGDGFFVAMTTSTVCVGAGGKASVLYVFYFNSQWFRLTDALLKQQRVKGGDVPLTNTGTGALKLIQLGNTQFFQTFWMVFIGFTWDMKM